MIHIKGKQETSSFSLFLPGVQKTKESKSLETVLY